MKNQNYKRGNTTKKILILVLVLLFAVSLAGCNGGNEGSSRESGNDESGGDAEISVIGAWVCSDELIELMEESFDDSVIAAMKKYVITFNDDGTYIYDYGDPDLESSAGTYTISEDKITMVGEGAGEFTIDGDRIVHEDGIANYMRK